MNTKIIKFNKKGDEKGWLTPLEENVNIPFNIKRVYYIYNTTNKVVRGNHAHINLDQVLVCVSGSCMIGLDDGNKKNAIRLNSPNKGLFIGEKVWHTMYEFSKDCVLLVLASDLYNEEKYIRDYNEFLKVVKNV